MFITLNKNTKKARKILDNVIIDCDAHKTLYDCYNSYSLKKQKAYNYCVNVILVDIGDTFNIKNEMSIYDTELFKIASYNKNFFTVIAKYKQNVYYITPSADYKIIL